MTNQKSNQMENELNHQDTDFHYRPNYVKREGKK